MTRTKLILAVLATAAGLAGVSQAQAGAGSFMLGSATFVDRCEANGGDVYGNLGCDLGFVAIDCSFVGADTYCQWDGPQNQRDVRRVLGAAKAESIVGGEPGKKKKYGKDMMLDLDFSP